MRYVMEWCCVYAHEGERESSNIGGDMKLKEENNFQSIQLTFSFEAALFIQGENNLMEKYFIIA